jgi:hypothetical protein
MATAAEKPRRDGHMPVAVEAGLQALVLAGGSSRKASRVCGVPFQTLENWKTLHRARIEVIRRERGPELERMAIEGFRAFIVAAEEVKVQALEVVRGELEAGTCKDPARAMQSIAITQGIATQRMLELDGRPSGVKPERSLGELLGQLKQLGAIAQGSVDGSAVELPAATPDKT